MTTVLLWSKIHALFKLNIVTVYETACGEFDWKLFVAFQGPNEKWPVNAEDWLIDWVGMFSKTTERYLNRL